MTLTLSLCFTQEKILRKLKHKHLDNLPLSFPQEPRFWFKSCDSEVPALTILPQKQVAKETGILISQILMHLRLGESDFRRALVWTEAPWETLG